MTGSRRWLLRRPAHAQAETFAAWRASNTLEVQLRRLAGFAVAVAVLALLSVAVAAPASKKNPDQNMRVVQGVVSDANENPVDGAVVQLKNTKTLQIRSFITKDHGAYYFNGLNQDVDYELHAEYKGAASSTRTLSSFDSRKQAIINLKLASR